MTASEIKDFLERLDKAIKRAGLTKAKFARLISVSHPAVHHWFKGNMPRSATIDLICLRLGINKEWLLVGVGEMDYHSYNQDDDWVRRQAQAEGLSKPEIVNPQKPNLLRLGGFIEDRIIKEKRANTAIFDSYQKWENFLKKLDSRPEFQELIPEYKASMELAIQQYIRDLHQFPGVAERTANTWGFKKLPSLAVQEDEVARYQKIGN
ncbi:MAG: helix-turn-helix domain-containing protein [Verrucomicrobiales bacterium]|jgi:transcriptional regulator with XRE-family HTH domain|nr:helix-turn-helix domain-containing protein [Verrucomicrobiales bacterium]